MKKFGEKIFILCKQIPRGKVSTYKKIAEAIDNPKAFRAVGNILNKNKLLVKVPCHRVVRSDGSVGGYVCGQDKKIDLLKKEGIEVKNKKIDLDKYLFE